MSHTIQLYLRLVSVQIRSQLAYPASFLFDLLVNGGNLIIYFLSLALIFEKFKNIGGWKLGEVAFLWGLVEISFGVMDMLFSGFDPDTFSQLVRLGSFDQLLLRPAGITLQVLGARFVLRRWGRILQGLIIFGVSLSLLTMHWTPARLFYLPVVVVSQVLFFGGLFIIGATLTFWTVQPIEAVNIFTYGGSEMIAYPMHIYPDWIRCFFTYLVPAIFINYYPALYLLDKPDPFGMPGFARFLAPLAGLGLFMAALLFWQYGLKHYQSTGS
jgi:ABC-2 type transport system permease protein